MKLSEMSPPQNIPDVDFDLSTDPKNNAKIYQLTKSSKSKLAEKIGRYNLYKIGHKYILVDDATSEVMYYVQYEIQNLPILRFRAVVQTAVWRSPILGADNIARDVFWKYLFPLQQSSAENIRANATDRQQTSFGKAFWVRRVTEAIDKKLFVYWFNHTNNDGRDRLVPITSLDHLKTLDKQIWGDENRYKFSLLLITANKLD